MIAEVNMNLLSLKQTFVVRYVSHEIRLLLKVSVESPAAINNVCHLLPCVRSGLDAGDLNC